MASFLHVWTLLVFSFVVVPADQIIITAEPGDNVILTCRAAENKYVIVVKWSRTDLESDHYVLRYRDKKFDPEFQSPSFRNRVDLLDVKNGDVSLVLKNVTTDDTGTYECRVVQRGNNQPTIKNTEPISIFNLRVEAGNQEKLKDGENEDGLIVGLSVCAGLVVVVVVVVVVAVLLRRRQRNSSPRPEPPPAPEDEPLQDTPGL